MASRLKWHGEAIKRRLDGELERRLTTAAILVTSRARKLIGIEGAGKPSKKGGKLRYGANPSRPGDPPHKQTGRLLASVAYEVSRKLLGQVSARVGTNIKYGRWLELGTRKMKARPWLRRSLNEMLAAIRAIMRRPM